MYVCRGIRRLSPGRLAEGVRRDCMESCLPRWGEGGGLLYIVFNQTWERIDDDQQMPGDFFREGTYMPDVVR